MSPTSNSALALTHVPAVPGVRSHHHTSRLGLPALPIGTVPRAGLEQSLTGSAGAAITIVQAPSGAGKTTGVAAWAGRVNAVDAVVWLQADALAHDVHRFWRSLRSALISTEAGTLPSLPAVDGDDAEWSGWISAVARALSERRRRWLIVLDDFPVGSSSWLGDQVLWLVGRSRGCLRLVVTASGPPAIDLRTVESGGSCARLGPDQLEMDGDEVGAVLAATGVHATPEAVRSLTDHTFGWARGVGLAARLLTPRDGGRTASGSDPRPVADSELDELDRAIDSLVDREVLTTLTPAERELVIRTSVADEVTPTLARAVLGPDHLGGGPLGCAQGFVDSAPGGSFRCHPLLRRSARRRLDADWPVLARSARRKAAEWYLAHGRLKEGVALAARVDDPGWLARLLLTALAVPSIAIGALDALPIDGWADVERADPLIAAATSAARGEPTTALAMLERTRTGEHPSDDTDLARHVSAAVIRMVVARQRADHEAGLALVDRCRQLVPQLGPTGRTAQLSAVLDLHQAIFLAGRGAMDSALAVLTAVPDVTSAVLAEQLPVADAVGLTAWLHAVRGDLTMAARVATSVLTARTADQDESGVGYAQLAAAWVHLERRELDQAAQRLGHATRLDARHRDPWLVAARCLTEARLATASGDPDIALRLLAAEPATTEIGRGGWLADRLQLARAEAHLAAGDPQRALATLTPEPRQAAIESRILAAVARRAVGDRRGEQALLATLEGQVDTAPLPVAVQVWTLSARLAAETGKEVRARLLVARALRAAERETLRLSLSLVGPWLSTVLDSDPELRRRHRGLIESVRRVREPAVTVPIDITQNSAGVLESLTERELQVLEGLAQLSTTEEIAAELFVSPNTVKTHIKSVFLKLAVNRHSDAVRQGRRLGLC